MSGWVSVCSRLYRGAARTFPHEFRAVCGDGLEQLGEDVVPLVWQQQGAAGMIRLFADLAMISSLRTSSSAACASQMSEGI